MHTIVTDGTSRLRPGMELVLTRWIALSGTARIAREKGPELLKRFPETLIREAKCFDAHTDTSREQEVLDSLGENEAFPLGEGGILAALWQIADRAGVGFIADLRKIPIRQETVEITELFDVNPYGLESRGALLAGTFYGLEAAEKLHRMGISAVVIGHVNPGPERILYNQDIKRYVDKPAEDEIYKLFPRSS